MFCRWTIGCCIIVACLALQGYRLFAGSKVCFTKIIESRKYTCEVQVIEISDT